MPRRRTPTPALFDPPDADDAPPPASARPRERPPGAFDLLATLDRWDEVPERARVEFGGSPGED